METGREMHVFRATDGGATSLAFSPDGARLLTTFTVGSSLIWNLAGKPD